MISRICNVCGLPKGACLHQNELKEYRSDLTVLRILWFSLGFFAAAISVLILFIIIHEKYI